MNYGYGEMTLEDLAALIRARIDKIDSIGGSEFWRVIEGELVERVDNDSGGFAGLDGVVREGEDVAELVAQSMLEEIRLEEIRLRIAEHRLYARRSEARLVLLLVVLGGLIVAWSQVWPT